MALFSLSPSVDVVEKDMTLIVPAVATSIGGFSGVSAWGPVNVPTTIDSENTLVRVFGEPDISTKRDMLTAAAFLSYANHLKFVRVAGADAKNSYNGGASAPRIENFDHYEATVSALSNVKWIGKYPGAKGNSVTVSIADAGTYATWEHRNLFGSAVSTNKVAAVADTSAEITFSGAVTSAGVAVGMLVTGTGIPANTTVLSVDSATKVTLSAAATATGAAVALVFTKFTGMPGTSAYVGSKGGSNDEVHVVVIDKDGFWSGTKGAVLEKFSALSKAYDAKDYAGATSYYVNVINRTSAYTWFGGTHDGADWGQISTTDFASMSAQGVYPLAGGLDDNDDIELSARIQGYSQFYKAEEIDVNMLMAAGLDTSDEQLVLNNLLIDICETRKDCIASVSPPMSAVVNNRGNELQALITFRGLMNSSSYGVMNSGWKYVYNVYADEYVWIPLSADIGGLCAHTDYVAEPWFSPAGLNRGFIKNAVKLAYNPGSKAERDSLYVEGINPVCVIPGEGIVLYGDKTMQTKPSAFDRINVRRLFIVLEKAIATSAKYMLFELNDAYTRAQFVSMVEPYLRTVKGRRGVTDFRVVCDETNNTAQVIDQNGFVANIMVKPARSINFVELTFTAVGTGVSFEEIVSQA